MKAAQYNQYGDLNVIEINLNAPKPQPGAGQILVEVKASGINPVEAAIRNGYMQQMLPLQFPVTLGGDFSGVVVEIGIGVTEFEVGDEVFGNANPFKGGSGSAAQFAAAKVQASSLKPTSIDHLQAAALPLAGSSAVQAINEHLQLKADQTILIHGGAGGIGSLAVQIAKALGAKVIATADADDVDFVKNLGADEVINYKTTDFTTVAKDLDAVFDTVGGEVTNKSLSVLKAGGILVTMAGQPDQELAQQKNVTAIAQMTKLNSQQLQEVKNLVDNGQVKPIVDSVFSLDETKAAYEALSQHPRGKVVIEVM